MFWHLFGVMLIIQLILSAKASTSESLETIEIIAEKKLSDFHLGSFYLIDEEEMKFKNNSLVSESLNGISGVISSQNGGPGARTSFFIRGTEARHVLFTIDNLKLNDPSNTDRQFDAAFLTSSFLKEIVLYKGPHAVMFGSDAMGGLVDMKTRKGENAPQSRLSFNSGSFGTVDASLSKDWSNKSSRGTVTWNSFRTDGISRLNKKRFNATERDASDVVQLASSSAHQWKPTLETDFLFSFLRGNNELDGKSDDNSHDKSRSDQYLVQQKTNFKISSNQAISLRNGVSRHQRESNTYAAGKNVYAGDLIQNELLLKKETDAYSLLLGSELEVEKLNQSDSKEDANLRSLFVQSSWKLRGFTLQAGLRGQIHSLYGAYNTGSTGFSIPMDLGTASLQYSQGVKAPSLYQLYGQPILGLPVGNKNLSPETNKSIEARFENKSIEISLFKNSLSNLITFTNQGYINQERFAAQGIELAANVRRSSLLVKPSLMSQQFRNEKSSILRRPQNSLGLDVSFFYNEETELFTTIRSYSSRKDLDLNSNIVKLNGFETMNLGVRIHQKFNDYGIQVVNLTNREYEELYGYSVLPRSLYFHYGHRF
jgi:vitamin B12 transporter